MKSIGQLFLSGALVAASVLGVRADLGLLEGPGAFRPGLYQAKGNAYNLWGLTPDSSVIPVEVVPGPVMANVIGTEAGCATAAQSYVNPVTGSVYQWNKQKTTFGYFGEMYMEAGVTYAFGKYFDDAARIEIGDPATLVLNHAVWNVFASGTYTPSATGWVSVRIFLSDDTGGKGPPNAAGINGTGLGMVYNRTGVTAQNSSDWQTVMDPGDMSLFRAMSPEAMNPIAGSVQTQSGYTLTLKGGESDATAQVYYGATGTDVSTWATTAEVTIPANGTCSVAIPWTGAAAPSIVIRSEGTDSLGAYSSQTEAFSLTSNMLRDVRAATPDGPINRIQVRGNLLFCASQPSAQVMLTLSASGTVVETREQTVVCGEDFLFDVSNLPYSTTLTYTVTVGGDASSAFSGTISIPRARTTLYWGGAATGTWAVGHPGAEVGGWQDANGVPCVFENGDSVVFGDAPQAVTITMQGDLAINELRVNAANNYQLGGASRTSSCVTSLAHFEKRGLGKLTLKEFGGTYTGDILFAEGSVDLNTSWNESLSPGNTVFGNLSVPHTLQVGVGNTNSIPVMTTTVNNYILTHATQTHALTTIVDAGLITMSQYQAHNVYGNVIFRNGGELKGHAGASKLYHVINDDIHVERSLTGEASKASRITGNGSFLACGPKKSITFYVDDVTSPNGTDVDNLLDFDYTAELVAAGFEEQYADFTWHKSGRGTMKIQNGTNRHIGDIYVDEGTLILGPGGVGNQWVDKTVFVNPGTRLQYSGRNIMTGEGNSEAPRVTIVLTDATVNPGEFNTFGTLKIVGQSVLEPGPGYWGRGAYRFGPETVVEPADTLVIEAGTNGGFNNFARLGYEKDRTSSVSEDGSVTNFYGKVEFCVKEAETHSSHFADCRMKIALYDIHDLSGTGTTLQTSATRHCGVLKTGSGVLELAGENEYTYLTDVKEGGLWLTGSIRADVAVRPGACMGGSGTIKSNLTLEEGGGFLVDATNATAQLTLQGDLVLPEKVILTVYNAEGMVGNRDPLVTGIPLPQVAGSVTAAGAVLPGVEAINTEAWRVNLKGCDEATYRGLRVRREEDNTLTILLDRSSTLIRFR